MNSNGDDFELNVGFRLDSSGKKIRKNSQWLQLQLRLMDEKCGMRLRTLSLSRDVVTICSSLRTQTRFELLVVVNPDIYIMSPMRT